MKPTICKECENTTEKIVIYKAEIVIKGKKIKIEGPRKVCANCDSLKFDSILDNEFSQLVIEKYNELYGITGKKLVKLRTELGVSQETFGKVLGIAKKTIIQYENKRVIPNDVYNTILRSLAKSKDLFYTYANINIDALSDYEKKRIFDKQESFLTLKYEPLKFILKEEVSPYTGYTVPKAKKIISLVQYLVNNIKGKTKLAKSLFLIDALSYSQNAQTMTGLQYAAINNGPIPDKFNSLLDYLIETEKINYSISENHNHVQYNYESVEEVSIDFFSESEQEIIIDVLTFVKRRTASRLSDLTHQLEVWKSLNIGDLINFDQLNDFSLNDWK